MQFVDGGPDVPEALLQAHEEGRVIFFCGAGISYPAGLPGFGGLVKRICNGLGTTLERDEQRAFDRGQFDAALDLLEQRLRGQRRVLRRALMTALAPKWQRKRATETQAALLRLARNREGGLRLVTTNFDRVFHRAARRNGLTFQAYAAPMLPIPKDRRWDGLVFLHGLLPEKEDDAALDRLVLTSGDFGTAYLTERWAARFVSELFRNYNVCFVGYSINDPVMRYMMDALAADRRLGGVLPQAWALGECEPGQECDKRAEWKAKGVTGILYDVHGGGADHSALHRTLRDWADVYRDGVQGKEAIVVRHAMAPPQGSTQQDDFVGRMLWALSDPSGLPAKRFAELDPVPPLDWVEAFADDRFEHHDLPRFDVTPDGKVDEALRFSLVLRPVPYKRAPWMRLVSAGHGSGQWDDVMFQLARWLVRHLNDPRLLLWVTERGGKLHNSFSELISHQLNGAPIDSLMHTLWWLVLSDRVASGRQISILYDWHARLERGGLSTALRLELRDILAPKVALKRRIRWGEEDAGAGTMAGAREQVDWNLVLTADHVHHSLQEQRGEAWTSALPVLLEEFQRLLLDALDLLRELGEANEREDRSYWDLPSIAPHRQNRGFHDWVSLIELLRDSWLAVRGDDRRRAVRIAWDWFALPYATFKRLALFAASQDDVIAPEEWVSWLLADDAWLLWSGPTRREVLRLFVLQGRQLAGGDRERLETAILAGPPRAMYRDDLEEADWRRTSSRAVWLHLAKLDASGGLGETAAGRLTALSTTFPEWRLAANEMDEFAVWISGTGDPDYEASQRINVAPRNWRGLVEWLMSPAPKGREFDDDTWGDVCRTSLSQSLRALYMLDRRGEWPIGRWQEALQVWAEDGVVARAWRYAAPVIHALPDAVLQDTAHQVTRWMQAASKAMSRHRGILLDLCRRVLALPLEARSGVTSHGQPLGRPITEAINHPVGHVTQALINLWFGEEPNDNDGILSDIATFFTELCDVEVQRFRHGRVLLGSRLIALFRVDRAWTERYLLPLFDWNSSNEAAAVWQGFLWSPRLYRPLLVAFRGPFLESARHGDELGEKLEQFASFLTYAALEMVDVFTVDELRSAMAALPQSALEQSARALAQALEGAADQREAYWKNRVEPFWQNVWPKSGNIASPTIALWLSELAIAARGEFPAALKAVQHWLLPTEFLYGILTALHESGLSTRFPLEALSLLDAVIAEQQWPGQELAKCLDEIKTAAPALARDARYQRLREYLRKFGL